ncbi:MAG: polyprenyl diphosphate synthase [Candidatus Micrarchaeota archaeon]
MTRVRKLSHLAIIPDGNRRYAKKHNLSFQQAYAAGFDKVKQVLEWNGESERMTLWALSLDNFLKRSSFELKIIFKLMQKHALESLENQKFEQEGIRVKFFGKREALPRALNENLEKLERQTDGGRRELNIAVAYSGRDELLQAAKTMAFDAKTGKIDIDRVDETGFESYLYFAENPDLVIRTGNAQRLSGLMPWQTAYSEIYFSKKLWPEFTKRDYDSAVEFYRNSETRHGK